jgi:hypothetical protein
MELDPQDKLTIIDQHMKNLLYTEYNLSLNLQEANSVGMKNQTLIDTLNDQLKDINLQKDVLQSELDKVNTLISENTVTN